MLRYLYLLVLFSCPHHSALAETQFADVAAAVGIHFQHRNGAQGQKHLPETMGAGVAYFDYDNDGRQDLYFVNTAGPATLYRNGQDGQFVDVSQVAGVGNSGYGMGVAAADYDNDGHVDLYITTYGPNLLYHNKGNGRFADVTTAAGVGHPGFGTGAAFGDYDNDGDVDLYVANYLDCSSDNPCYRGQNIRVYCAPWSYPTQPDAFYRNEGEGHFVELGTSVGLVLQRARELGAVFTDYDNDGDVDLYVAGDRTPNLLYRNTGGHFSEEGLLAGAAYNGDGESEAGMGVAVGDYNRDGALDIFVTNFLLETNTLYHNEDDGYFRDATTALALARISLPSLAWGTVFFDYDNDGDLDLFAANGHMDDNVELFGDSTYPQQNQLFRNDNGNSFTDVTHTAGPGLAHRQVSRGVAVGDCDNDGDLDIAVVNINDRAALLRNEGGNQQHWLSIRTVGQHSNRDGIGARVQLTADDLVQVAEVHSGGSYLSQHDLRLFFGLGRRNQIDELKIRWPDGAVQRLSHLAADQFLTVREEVAK